MVLRLKIKKLIILSKVLFEEAQAELFAPEIHSNLKFINFKFAKLGDFSFFIVI